MTDTPRGPTSEPKALHDFKNHLGVILGFADLLIRECAEGDPKRADLAEIRRSAEAAMRLLATIIKPEAESGEEGSIERAEHPDRR